MRYEDDEDDGITEIKRHCNSCNYLNDIESQFCSKCGKQLVKYEINTKPVNIIEFIPEIEKEKYSLKIKEK